jgi:hypothetical protein
MATILEKLVVTFGLDAAPFKEGQKSVDEAQKKNRETSDKTRKQMEEDGRKTVEAFRKIRNELVALVASFAGLNAIRHFTEEITHSDASIGRMARTLGMSTEDLWTWEKAMRQFGVTAADTDSALTSLTELQQGLNFGVPLSPDVATNLLKAGVDVGKFIDNSTTATDKLYMLAEAFQKIGAPAAEALAGPLRLSHDMVGALARGPDAIRAQAAAMRALGPLTDAQAAAAQRREQEWEAIQTRIENFQRYLVGTFWPVVEPIIQRMMRWWDAHQVEVIGRIKDAVSFLGAELQKVPWVAIGEDIKALARFANDAAQAFGGWGKTLLDVYAGLKLIRLVGWVAGLGAAGTAAAATGATAGAGGAAAAAGVGAGAAAVLGLFGVVAAALLGLAPKGTDVIDSSGKGEDERMEDMRRRQHIAGYGRDVYGPPTTLMNTSNSTSSTAHVDNINIYTNSADAVGLESALTVAFRRMGIISPANQGAR